MFDVFLYVCKTGFANIIKTLKEMDYLHLLLVCLIVGVFLAMLIRFFRYAFEKRVRLIWSLLAMLCAGVALFMCVIASAAGTLVFEPDTKPEDVVRVFLDSYIQRDIAAAKNYLEPGVMLPETAEGEDELKDRFYEALFTSFSYTISGETDMQDTHASVPVSFTWLDMQAMIPDISAELTPLLEYGVENRGRNAVFDENKEYRHEFLDEIYTMAVDSGLAKAQEHYITEEYTVELDYIDGEWKTDPGEGLINAFRGGVRAGEDFANNAKSEVLADLTYIPKIYTIAEDATVSPAPIPEAYGQTDDPAVITALFEEYTELVGDEDIVWREEGNFKGGDFRYYADETIFFVSWKEIFEDHYCAFAEVFVADGSQFRRKLAEDTYGSAVQKAASQLANEANAVIAMNGDYYKFRTEGVTVYNRELYRFKPYKLELCHVDSNGDLKFTYAGELEDEEMARKYVKDNDVLFTLAFGPVLVADGAKRETGGGYLLGQVNENYSRSAIGQLGEHHYLMMNLNYGYNTGGATISETANIMYDKGCRQAYALDGGQTAEMVINNKVYNAIDYGNERMVSDIIYFATALPEDAER
ncbi:MAG: phosphodiester glycosidase family protein [Lachnospiraceae bacterium]|nr:phosphodiester glycosidase family protein [Lachnospiraceae bacterium]